MKTKALVITLILLAYLPTAAQTRFPPAGAEPPTRKGLFVGNRIDEYFGEAYTDTSQHGFIFFQGEPIAFRLVVHNVGPDNNALVVNATNSDQLFQVQGFKGPLPAPGTNLVRQTIGQRFVDEEDFRVSIAFSSPVKVFPGGSFELPSQRETLMDVRDSVEWVMNLPTNLQPGLYRFVVRINGTDRAQRPLQGLADFRFEVRPSTVDNRPEILRRQGWRLLSKGDYEGARKAMSDLLLIHPNSSHAYTILATIADREGKGAEANGHRANADALMKAGRDQLLLKYERKGVIP